MKNVCWFIGQSTAAKAFLLSNESHLAYNQSTTRTTTLASTLCLSIFRTAQAPLSHLPVNNPRNYQQVKAYIEGKYFFIFFEIILCVEVLLYLPFRSPSMTSKPIFSSPLESSERKSLSREERARIFKENNPISKKEDDSEDDGVGPDDDNDDDDYDESGSEGEESGFLSEDESLEPKPTPRGRTRSQSRPKTPRELKMLSPRQREHSPSPESPAISKALKPSPLRDPCPLAEEIQEQQDSPPSSLTFVDGETVSSTLSPSDHAQAEECVLPTVQIENPKLLTEDSVLELQPSPQSLAMADALEKMVVEESQNDKEALPSTESEKQLTSEPVELSTSISPDPALLSNDVNETFDSETNLTTLNQMMQGEITTMASLSADDPQPTEENGSFETPTSSNPLQPPPDQQLQPQQPILADSQRSFEDRPSRRAVGHKRRKSRKLEDMVLDLIETPEKLKKKLSAQHREKEDSGSSSPSAAAAAAVATTGASNQTLVQPSGESTAVAEKSHKRKSSKGTKGIDGTDILNQAAFGYPNMSATRLSELEGDYTSADVLFPGTKNVTPVPRYASPAKLGRGVSDPSEQEILEAQKSKLKSVFNRFFETVVGQDANIEVTLVNEQKIEAERSEQRVRTELESFNQKRRAFLLPEDPAVLSDPSFLVRNKIINEIVQTERDYIDDLELMITVFYKPLLGKGIITMQQQQTIFSNITVIYDISLHILEMLENSILDVDHPRLAPCFTELASFRKMYSDYCNNQRQSTELVRSLEKKSSPFRQLLEEALQNPRLQGLSFLSYIIKPVQRICKYPLLLKELIRREPDPEDNIQLTEALRLIEEVVIDINETKRAAENIAKISQIQKNVKGTELMQPGRIFVREDTFQETARSIKDPTKQENIKVYYCIFNDVLLRAERKKQSKFGTLGKTNKTKEKLAMAELIPVYSISIRSLEDGAHLKNCIAIEYRGKKTYIVSANSKEEKDHWMEDIKTQINQYSTNSIQSKEAAQKPGTLGIMPSGVSEKYSRGKQVPNSFSPTKQGQSSASTTTLSASKTSVIVERVSSSGELENSIASSNSSGTIQLHPNRTIKCYLNKGTAEQRIRKVPLLSWTSIEQLVTIISKEFEWNLESLEGVLIGYVDTDAELVEISPSTSIEELMREVRALHVIRVPDVIAQQQQDLYSHFYNSCNPALQSLKDDAISPLEIIEAEPNSPVISTQEERSSSLSTVEILSAPTEQQGHEENFLSSPKENLPVDPSLRLESALDKVFGSLF